MKFSLRRVRQLTTRVCYKWTYRFRYQSSICSNKGTLGPFWISFLCFPFVWTFVGGHLALFLNLIQSSMRYLRQNCSSQPSHVASLLSNDYYEQLAGFNTGRLHTPKLLIIWNYNKDMKCIEVWKSIPVDAWKSAGAATNETCWGEEFCRMETGHSHAWETPRNKSKDSQVTVKAPHPHPAEVLSHTYTQHDQEAGI